MVLRFPRLITKVACNRCRAVQFREREVQSVGLQSLGEKVRQNSLSLCFWVNMKRGNVIIYLIPVTSLTRQCGRGRCKGTLHDTLLDWDNPLPARDLAASWRHARRADLSICLGTR
jgi:hypothetical protein